MKTAQPFRRLHRLGLLALVALAFLSACQPAPATPTPIAPQGSILLADTFAPPNPAWARFDTDTSAVYAMRGELFIEDRGRGIAAYTRLLDQTYVDARISVIVRMVQGTMNNWMGALCRQQDEDNYYLLAISADGYYLIMQVENGVASPLVGPTFSEAIRQGKTENALEVACLGDTLSLAVNGELLATYTDAALRQVAGYIGLFADAVDPGQMTTVAFGNFVLTDE